MRSSPEEINNLNISSLRAEIENHRFPDDISGILLQGLCMVERENLKILCDDAAEGLAAGGVDSEVIGSLLGRQEKDKAAEEEAEDTKDEAAKEEAEDTKNEAAKEEAEDAKNEAAKEEGEDAKDEAAKEEAEATAEVTAGGAGEEPADV